MTLSNYRPTVKERAAVHRKTKAQRIEERLEEMGFDINANDNEISRTQGKLELLQSEFERIIEDKFDYERQVASLKQLVERQQKDIDRLNDRVDKYLSGEQ